MRVRERERGGKEEKEELKRITAKCAFFFWLSLFLEMGCGTQMHVAIECSGLAYYGGFSLNSSLSLSLSLSLSISTFLSLTEDIEESLSLCLSLCTSLSRALSCSLSLYVLLLSSALEIDRVSVMVLLLRRSTSMWMASQLSDRTSILLFVSYREGKRCLLRR
jgi:hypothetical protein